jgi:hypothetical protein
MAAFGASIFLSAFVWLASTLARGSRYAHHDSRLPVIAIALGFAMMLAPVLVFVVVGME